MFSSSTTNTLMSPFPQYFFPSSSPYQQPHQPQPQPQPQPPPSLPPIPPLILNQNDNIFLHPNHQYDHLFSLANAQIPESTLINLGVISNTTTTTTANIMTNTTSSSTKQDLIINGGGSRRLAPNFLPKRPGTAATKKDRHSKIYTARGLRDRRVRLSIDIAREFFDLHDMLGFDKASKTLEWLLTKSKKAIKELSRSKLRTSTTTKSSTTLSSTGAANSDQCEQAMPEVKELVAAADHDINVPKRNVSKEKLIDAETLSEAALMNLLAKESRAKARDRARARTKEKRHNSYCTTTTSTTACNNNDNNNNNHKIRPSSYSNNMEKCSSSGGSSSHQISNHHQLLIRTVLLNQLDHHHEKGLLVRMEANHDHHQDDDDDEEEEPVVMIKRKLYDHRDDHEGQFCGISSKGGASNNVIYSSSPSLLLTQNWDNDNNISTAPPHPAAASFCLPT